MTVIGILGAGKLGTALAKLATAAGLETHIAGSGDPERIRMVIDVMSPDAVAARPEDVASAADVVVLAVPLSRIDTLPSSLLEGKLVIDATNYWPPTDGPLEIFQNGPSSLVVADRLPGARIVKTLSHLGYHALETDARPAGAPDRHAIAVAGDDPVAVGVAAETVDRLGFDPVVIPGGLKAGAAFGPGTAAFGLSTNQSSLRRVLDVAAPSNGDDVRRR
jgi:8-hydroxy-5-deazaflavin:NADPH oxidoreductase